MASAITSGGQQKASRGARLMEFIPGSRLRFKVATSVNQSARIQLPVGAKPTTCTVGELWVDSTGAKLNICTAADTWTVVGGQS